MNTQDRIYEGYFFDVLNRCAFEGSVEVKNGRITAISRKRAVQISDLIGRTVYTPGFVNSHIHIESSLMPPVEFGRWAATCGVIATVSDPHEIGNVGGVAGIRYFLRSAGKSPIKHALGVPSCVPASPLGRAGAILDADTVCRLLTSHQSLTDGRATLGTYLAEVMNFPGVWRQDPSLLQMINMARSLGLPIDGHLPMAIGQNAWEYFSTGISTNHECFEFATAADQLRNGLSYLQIREGSAARNFDALWPLFDPRNGFQGRLMLCSDDLHPHELIQCNIDALVRRLLDRDVSPIEAFHAACVLPVQHYRLNVGLLREGDPADFIELDNFGRQFTVARTYVDGELVAEAGKPVGRFASFESPQLINFFNRDPLSVGEIALPLPAGATIAHGIQAIDGEIVTDQLRVNVTGLSRSGNFINSTPHRDILKLVVVNRYDPSMKPAVGLVSGIGLGDGAFATTVCHDDHNIVAVGTNDQQLLRAINLAIEAKGGIVCVGNGRDEILPLPIAGLMSDRPFQEVSQTYRQLLRAANALGSNLRDPFMTLSFLALPVIPKAKMTPLGLADVDSQQLIPVFE